jgi:hypothetical protein
MGLGWTIHHSATNYNDNIDNNYDINTYDDYHTAHDEQYYDDHHDNC